MSIHGEPRIPSHLHWILAQTDARLKKVLQKGPFFWSEGPVEKNGKMDLKQDTADANWSGCSADVSNGIADALVHC